MSRFDISETRISDLFVIQRKKNGDSRGYLERMFCEQDLRSILGTRRIIQINTTLTRGMGVVRGLHFQMYPSPEMKLVTCLRGEIFDVAVDLRKDSPTFLQWHAELLNDSNRRTFVIPEGFAHGFQTLTEDCELLYLHTAAYNKEAEGGLDALDPTLNISWPQPILVRSDRDQNHPRIGYQFTGIDI